MRALNGHSRMTPEEKNARRRELDKDPFHHALSRKTANAWREAHKDELNARRRAKYAENIEHEHEYRRKWREENKDKTKAAWKRYSSKPGNKTKLREKWRERAKDPVIAERRRELRRKRMLDPQRRKHVNWQKRFSYHAHKHDRIGIRAMVRQEWREKWQSVVAAGDERIEKYLKRCGVRVRSFFAKWRRAGMPTEIDDIMEVLGYGEERRLT